MQNQAFRPGCIAFSEFSVFRAPVNNEFEKHNTSDAKSLLLWISAIPPSWFAKSQNCLGGIAQIRKVGVSCGLFCICESGVVEALENLKFQNCNTSGLIC